MVISNAAKMGLFLFLICLRIIFAKNVNVTGISSLNHEEDFKQLDCERGTLLSSSVCVPEGYLKGEAPGPNTDVNTKIEINNIREVNDKKMRITLDYYQELLWIDNRIMTSFFSSDKHVSVLNNNLIGNIWKPDLWILNLYDFELHSVLEPTGGLMIAEQHCESDDTCTKGDIIRNTLVTYNLEAQATIYCNFHFLNYPMDTQYCDFVMDGSYPVPGVVHFVLKSGQFGVTNKNSNTDDFTIDISFRNNTENVTGIHSTIKMERCLLPYIIKYYLPCIAIIIVSLISFLISIDSLPARVALLVTQFLTLTNILIAQQVYILKVLIYCLYNYPFNFTF